MQSLRANEIAIQNETLTFLLPSYSKTEPSLMLQGKDTGPSLASNKTDTTPGDTRRVIELLR